MSLLDLIDQKRPEILRIAAKYGARDVRLFGSVARGEDHAGSDVDLLADMHNSGGWAPEWTLKEELEGLLGVKVDVIASLHAYLRDRVLDEAIPLDAANFRELAVIESQRPHSPLDRDNTYLRLMVDYARDIVEISDAATREAFLTDRVPQRALVMTLVLLGECAGKVSDEFRSKHPAIPWAKIVGLRNVSVHNYPGLELVDVWDNTIQGEVPKLKTQLEALL